MSSGSDARVLAPADDAPRLLKICLRFLSPGVSDVSDHGHPQMGVGLLNYRLPVLLAASCSRQGWVHYNSNTYPFCVMSIFRKEIVSISIVGEKWNSNERVIFSTSLSQFIRWKINAEVQDMKVRYAIGNSLGKQDAVCLPNKENVHNRTLNH